MYLIRLLTLNNLVNNRRILARHLFAAQNDLVDALSQLQLKRFRKLAPYMANEPTPTSPLVWPALQIWQEFKY